MGLNPGEGAGITIPSLMVGMEDGRRLQEAVAAEAGAVVTIEPQTLEQVKG
jgi:hypothetical protein